MQTMLLCLKIFLQLFSHDVDGFHVITATTKMQICFKVIIEINIIICHPMLRKPRTTKKDKFLINFIQV